MQASKQEREPDVFPEVDDLDNTSADDQAGAACRPEADGCEPVLTEELVDEVLAAVVDMALRSKRRQADFDAALQRAGVKAERAVRLAALEQLRGHGCVDNVVELSDGGVLLSVTALGLERLGGARAG